MCSTVPFLYSAAKIISLFKMIAIANIDYRQAYVTVIII